MAEETESPHEGRDQSSEASGDAAASDNAATESSDAAEDSQVEAAWLEKQHGDD